MIDLRQTLDIIHSGTWLSLAAVQADEKRGKAGKIIRLKRCKLHRNRTPNPTTHTHSPPFRGDQGGRNPHHALHFTRNLITPSNQIVKIHPLLIFEINNQPVI